LSISTNNLDDVLNQLFFWDISECCPHAHQGRIKGCLLLIVHDVDPSRSLRT